MTIDELHDYCRYLYRLAVHSLPPREKCAD